jgi:hypothetical protein
MQVNVYVVHMLILLHAVTIINYSLCNTTATVYETVITGVG